MHTKSNQDQFTCNCTQTLKKTKSDLEYFGIPHISSMFSNFKTPKMRLEKRTLLEYKTLITKNET